MPSSVHPDDGRGVPHANRSGPRTVVLGFDALSMEYLDAFDLQNFDSLRERGISAPLESTFPRDVYTVVRGKGVAEANRWRSPIVRSQNA